MCPKLFVDVPRVDYSICKILKFKEQISKVSLLHTGLSQRGKMERTHLQNVHFKLVLLKSRKVNKE